jgi:hypothetical protein
MLGKTTQNLYKQPFPLQWNPLDLGPGRQYTANRVVHGYDFQFPFCQKLVLTLDAIFGIQLGGPYKTRIGPNSCGNPHNFGVVSSLESFTRTG